MMRLTKLNALHAVWAIEIFVIGWAVLIKTMWLPGLEPSIDVDTSYRMVLNAIHDYGLQFGDDILITYGPLAFLVMPDLHPVMSVYKIFINAIAYATTLLILFRIIRPKHDRNFIAYSLAIIVLVIFSVYYGLLNPLFMYFLPIIIYVAAHFSKEFSLGPIASNALILLLAISSLTKFTYLMLAVSAIIIVTVDDVIFRRKIPTDAIKFLLAFIAIWLLSNQDPANLPNFITGSLEIVSAYGTALSLNGGWREALLLALFISVAFIITASIATANFSRRRDKGLLALAAWGMLLLVAMKNGFVRFSPSHVAQGYIYLTIIGLFCAFFYWPLARSTKTRLSLLSGAILPALLLTAFIDIGLNHQTMFSRMTQIYATTMESIQKARIFITNPGIYKNRYEQGLSEIEL